MLVDVAPQWAAADDERFHVAVRVSGEPLAVDHVATGDVLVLFGSWKLAIDLRTNNARG